LRDGDTELEQLTVNPGSPLQRIGVVHLPNQGDGGRNDGFSAGFARAAFPSPEKSEPRAMPSGDGAGLNQEQSRFLSTPGMGEPHPQGSIHGSQPWAVGTSAQDQ
jgi:hypothetical protein